VTGGISEDEVSRAELAAQLKAMGAPPEVVEKARGKRVIREFAVWPENEPALRVFLAMETQWRPLPMGMAGSQPQGLEYTALPAVMEFCGIEPGERGKVFKQLQIMEDAALTAMRKERANGQ
jgi:hypothetical protein